MTLSACITINERSIATMDAVFSSMKGQAFDEFVIVLDAAERSLASWSRHFWRGDERVKFVEINRLPGWRSPVKAWNRGYEAVTGDVLYCFSSETVQEDGNLAKAARLIRERPCVLFGKAECSCGPQGREVDWQGTAPGNLLCSASHPRPRGFIWAAPMETVRQIGGWDENFDRGFWYDEADFFFRLWKAGLPFVFDDSIYGLHLHHERPALATQAGAAGINANAAYILQKWGSLNPTAGLGQHARREGDSRLVWEHQNL